MYQDRRFNPATARWRRLHKALTFSLLLALLAGLLPGGLPVALVRTMLPAPAAGLVEAAASLVASTSPATALAAPLAQALTGSSVLTITKSVVGSANSGPFNVTVTGPNGYSNNTTVSAGTPTVLTGLASGVYTVTEASPGAGWTTSYTATASSGAASGGSSNAVVTLQNANTAPAFTLPGLTSSALASDAFATNGSYSGGTGWSGSWIEDESNNEAGTSDSASAGLVQVVGNVAQIFDFGRSLARSVVLPTNSCSVSLTFSYYRTNFATAGATSATVPLLVEVSQGGGTPYIPLLTLTNASTTSQSATVSLPAAGGRAVRLRWRVARTINIASTEGYFLDNVVLTSQSGQLCGTVYRDFNSDGQITANGTITDTGVSGVMVTAYDRASATVGSATTNLYGSYIITPTANGPYRVEFSALPSGYEPTTHSTANGTSTQFVSSAPAANVNFGILAPCDYCQNNPKLVTSIYWNGTTATGGVMTGTVALNYDSSGATKIADANEVGAVWGVAYQRQTKQVYLGAVIRRHVGLLNQPGTIYRLDYASSATNPPVSVLTTIASAGSDPRAPGDLATALTSPSHDPQAYTNAGRLGLGGLAMSLDGNTLYAVNLMAKTVEQINPTTGAQGTPLAIPNPGCPNNDAHPWAVKVTPNGILVGTVCENATPLRAYVQQYANGSWTVVDLDTTSPNTYYDLSYEKEGVFSSTVTCTATQVDTASQWHAWTDTWPGTTCVGSVGYVFHPQPILSAIEVDVDGSLILGLLDRMGIQGGLVNYAPAAADTTSYSVVSGGDIRRVCNTASGYVPEGASGCTQNDTGNDTPGPRNATQAGIVDAGHEFYTGEQYSDASTRLVNHFETALGGLAFWPGTSQLVAMAFDAEDFVGANAGGVKWLNNSTGNTQNGVNLYVSSTTGTMSKSVGLGDVEALCDPAPIEIGNRVWNDLDGDGVQDAGEPGLNGITVSRQGPTNTVTTVTDANGLYYFGNLRTATAYTLTITPPSGYSVTSANAAALSGAGVTSNHAISDTIDSDAALVSGKATIYYTTGSAGQNNHGLDFGFTQPVTGQVTITNTAPGAIQVSKQVATSDGSSQSVGGVFTINVNCGGATVSPSSSQTVAAGGSVTFSNIPAGATCTVSENTSNLPAAPSGYGWVAHQLTPGSVTIVAGQTSAVTAKNTLAPLPAASGVLTITKTVNGVGSGPFNINVSGPNGYHNATTVSPGIPLVLTGLASGVYTVTESSPGAGWTTVYTATPGIGGGSTSSATNAVVTLQNANTATLATTPISGQVYRDYNSDGLISTGTVNDTGVSGVTVTAYDKNGNSVGSATSATNGAYTINPSASGPYRVEFSNLPAGYEPTTHGSGNGTSTQFVTTVAGASNVNFGINVPCDYCQNNPQLATNMYRMGNYLPAAGVVYALPYHNLNNLDGNINGTTADNSIYTPARPLPTQLATNANVGATWGLAYNGYTHKLYASAYLKRKTQFGALSGESTGAIYTIDPGGATAPSVFVDLNSVFGAGTAGLNPHPVATTAFFNDTATRNLIGKVGLGDLALAHDGTRLYTVNLADRQLYAIPTTGALNSSTIQHFAIPTTGLPTNAGVCASADVRPFGLGIDKADQLYVGGVCSGETMTNTNLTAYVWRFQPSSPNFTLVFTAPLTFSRNPFNAAYTGGYEDFRRWQVTDETNTNIAQPMLSDLVFDGDDIILGLRDRYADQMPGDNKGTAVAPFPRAFGDVLRACPGGLGWQLENNASCGSVTTLGANNAAGQTVPRTFGSYGPGGGEYYYQDNPGDGLNARENGLGGLAHAGGYPVITTAYDPIYANDAFTGTITTFAGSGFQRYDNTSGQLTGAYELYSLSDLGETGSLFATFGKVDGQGDVELLCDPAPIEIGNRVWNDLNGNGVQDPGEPGVSGLTVSRQGPTNTVATVTDANGLYYFNNLRTATAYTLTMSVPSGYNLTQANAAALSGAGVSSNQAISDTIDSDAALVSGKATIYYTTGSAGQNNHGLDFGFTQPVKGQVDIINTAPPLTTSYIVSKILNTPDPVKPGDAISFTIRITNTGGTVIATLPLSDTYNYRYVQYVSATPAPHDNVDDGQIDWSDVTGGGSLAAGAHLDVIVNFIAFNDTTLLSGGATINTASSGAQTSSASVRINAPTAVEIADKVVQVVDGQVVVQWSTVSETPLVGFYLWREDGSGQVVRLTSDLILAQKAGQSSGAAYRYTDPTATLGAYYRYVLELLDTDGLSSYSEVGRVGGQLHLFIPTVRR